MGVFIDLKLGGDIPNTVAEFMRACMNSVVRFLTIVEAVPTAITLETIRTARNVRGDRTDPRLLLVPYLSSLDSTDLGAAERHEGLNDYITRRAAVLLEAGCDGLIVSGDAIRACRERFGPAIDIVSPGIRPAWSASSDDHKRLTTPAAAIELGSSHLVVGRPITKSAQPREAAQRVIDEIDGAFEAQVFTTERVRV